MTIQQVFKTYKLQILIVVSFIVLENLAWIIEPTFFGKLLDALIDRFYEHEKKINIFLPLFVWIGVYLLNVAGGALHRYFGGKIYSKMYAEIATKVIMAAKKKHDSSSTMLAHAELAKDYITFLKERLPEISWQFLATFGAITAMFFYDWRIAAVCLGVVVPLGLLNNVYRNRVIGLQKQINDSREDLYRMIETRDTSRIQEHYFNMVRPQRRIARWNSFDYGVMKIILMFIFIVVLFICVDVDDFSTGKIYAVVAYLWTFISSTEYLPALMESLSSVKELSNRLKTEEV